MRSCLVPEIAPAEWPLERRVLYELVAFACIAESANVALLSVTLEHVREPTLRELTRTILADEVAHSRLGWAHLDQARRKVEVAWLGDAVVAMLEGSVTEELWAPTTPPDNLDELLAHGVLPRAMRIDVFRATLRDVVLPGLAGAGVATEPARAWMADRLAKRDDTRG